MILCGHVIDMLDLVPENVVQTTVTSPPFWGHRDYNTSLQIWQDKLPLCLNHDFVSPKPQSQDAISWSYKPKRSQAWRNQNICSICGAWKGELGGEPTPEMYIEHLCSVFDRLRDKQRDDGLLWVNIGDTYASGKSRYSTHNDTLLGGGRNDNKLGNLQDGSKPDIAGHPYLEDGDLVGIPSMFATEMQKRGWSLRSEIIWVKKRHKPESVIGWQWDRHIVNTVPCNGCAKCDNGLILRRNNGRPTRQHEIVFMFSKKFRGKQNRYFFDTDAVRQVGKDGKLKNIRDVWEIDTEPSKGIHSAVFPKQLAENCVLAGSPPMCCGKCHAPYARISGEGGWKQTCGCSAPSIPSTVMDIFGGSGTTALVAKKNGRDYIHIDLNPRYIELASAKVNPELQMK